MISTFFNEYTIHLMILVGIYFILATAFNISFGLGRLMNLSHVASYAIGAYITALCSKEFDLGVFTLLPLSAIGAAFFALLVGVISARLSEEYFAIGTLAFNAIITALLINWKSLTRGVLGVTGIPRPEFLEIDFFENKNFLLFVIVINIIVLTYVWWLWRSRFSRALRAQAEYEPAAQAIGIHSKKIRNISFIISSGIAGLAGSIFAYYLNFIDPSSFSLAEMVAVLSMVVIGRPGSFWGVLIATAFLVLLPEPLRQYELPADILGPMRQFLYALILFIVVYWNRKVIFPTERKI